MKNKELLSVEDGMMLCNVLLSDDYSEDFIKQLIHDLDTCFSADIHNTNRNEIVWKIIKEKYMPNGDEFAKQLMAMLQKALGDDK